MCVCLLPALHLTLPLTLERGHLLAFPGAKAAAPCMSVPASLRCAMSGPFKELTSSHMVRVDWEPGVRSHKRFLRELYGSEPSGRASSGVEDGG